ncbi:glycosyltransferase family 25 protein (plasmid) [Pseudoalteromonas sp. T1lg65]|uniref:glycosyltransferase family 25 protein n=1 Tax=Pseudoalteromonas sp. T1lg65 TaxID=2077101 RepID=UPI003F792C4F
MTKAIEQQPQVFLINLDSSTERLANATAQFEHFDIEFERISATLGSAMDITEKAQYYSHQVNATRFFRPLTDGEIGCYVSHLRVLKEIVTRKLPYAIVFEDDFNLVSDLKEVFAAISEIPSHWDVIKLAQRGIGKAKVVVASQRLTSHFDIALTKKIPAGTCAQAISYAGAKKILETFVPFGRPVDTDLQHSWEQGIDVFQMSPPPVQQGTQFESTIATQTGRNKPKKRFWAKQKYHFKKYLMNQKRLEDMVKRFDNAAT